MTPRYAYYDRDADIAWLPTGESENVLSEEVNWGRTYPAVPARLDTVDGLRGALSSGSTWARHAFALASAPRSTLNRPNHTPPSR
jgi:hypothetical protein